MFLGHQYNFMLDLFDDSSSQIGLLKKTLSHYEKEINSFPNDKKMKYYTENIRSILPFFQGLILQITTDNISILYEISNKINFVSLQKVSEIFINVQNINNKITEITKVESSLSKIDENNFEKNKFQITQTFLAKDSKYHNLLIDILIYYTKIRPTKNHFYIKLIESLVQSKANNSNRKSSSMAQSNTKNLAMTVNTKRIIKPQTKSPQNRQKLSSTLQFNKIETFETNEYSSIIIKEIKNNRIKNLFSNYFLFQLFNDSIIMTKKQKLTILNIVKESNSDDLKEWFSSSLKSLTKEQLSLYNSYTTKLNEEQIRESIRKDDLNEVKIILSQKNKRSNDKSMLNNKIIFDFYCPKNKDKEIYLSEYAAVFGSINCFKYFLTNDFKIPRNIITKAIRGGNLEIISLCIEKGYKIDFQKNIKTSIKYHQNKILKFLMNYGEKEKKLTDPSLCISTYNFKAFKKTEFSEFNFILDLIDYNNIILIEIISPFLHSFIRLIMAYYSIINHSNDIASFLLDSIEEICYPMNYLSQLNSISSFNNNNKFNLLIKSLNEEKFVKEIVFISFCFITDNVDFLKYLLVTNQKVQIDKKKKAQLAIRALSSFNYNTDFPLCQKFIFSFISGFVTEEQVIALFLKDNSSLLLALFEQFNSLQLKFTKIQLDSIVLNLLKKSNCRPIIFRNYKQFISDECLLEFLDEVEIQTLFELISYETVDSNVILTSYLNKLSLKYRPESRENQFNSSLTYRRLATSYNEREKDKEFINLCSSHSSFNIIHEVDENRNSFLHLIVMNDLDYVLRFIFANPLFRQIINKVNKFNKTPFLMAIEFQNIECIQILIEQSGVNFVSYDISEMNAFNYAIQNNLIDVVSKIFELRLKSIQNANKKNRKSEIGQFDIVNNVTKSRHVSPICCAKTADMIQLLLNNGANQSSFNGVDKDGRTLLVSSLESQSLDFKFVLDNLSGIDINAKCEDGKTFLMRAIELNKYQDAIDHIENTQNSQKNLSNSQETKNSTTAKSSLSNSTSTKSSLSNSTGAKSSLSSSIGTRSNPSSSTGAKSSLSNSIGKKTSLSKSGESKYSLSLKPTESPDDKLVVDYTVKSRESSYLASAIKANNSELIEKFLPISLKAGDDQAALIESMVRCQSLDPTIAAKLMQSLKKKLELTPRQVVEDVVKVPDKYYDFILKGEKDPHKAFNFVYNDQTVITSSIENDNNSLVKFLLSMNDVINLDLNWCNRKGMNCFDVAIEKKNREITEILFNETKLNKSLHSFSEIIIQKNKFSCSLKLNETAKNKWISDTLKKKKVQLFEEIIENNNFDLLKLIVNDINDECLINKGFSIAVAKRNESIINSLLDSEVLNPDFALKIAVQQNNAALFKKLVLKFNESVNMNKFVEFVMDSSQGIKNVYSSYANISVYTKSLLKNETDFVFSISDVDMILHSH